MKKPPPHPVNDGTAYEPLDTGTGVVLNIRIAPGRMNVSDIDPYTGLKWPDQTGQRDPAIRYATSTESPEAQSP